MAEQGANVLGFDYSDKMIELAKKCRAYVLDNVDFRVCDATNYEQLLSLKQTSLFNKAVANMAIMDISDIEPLFRATHEMLVSGGIFVFATHHPCFTYPNNDYFTACIDKGFAIEGQPVLQNYYHRSVGEIFNCAFQAGFILAGFHEIPFSEESTPIIMIIRLQKK